MPDTATSTSSARPVRRVGRTVNVIIQISLFVAAVVAANYLSCTNHKRYDLTEKRNFSLSDFSEKFLKGKMLQEHQSPVQAIVVMRRTSPHYSRVYHLLDEYQRIAGDAIKLECGIGGGDFFQSPSSQYYVQQLEYQSKLQWEYYWQ